jgi:hypothetical protein
MRTEVVSKHIFRRTARAQERDLERRRKERLEQVKLVGTQAEVQDIAVVSYRVSRRSGGFRWVVEKVTR